MVNVPVLYPVLMIFCLDYAALLMIVRSTGSRLVLVE